MVNDELLRLQRLTSAQLIEFLADLVCQGEECLLQGLTAALDNAPTHADGLPGGRAWVSVMQKMLDGPETVQHRCGVEAQAVTVAIKTQKGCCAAGWLWGERDVQGATERSQVKSRCEGFRLQAGAGSGRNHGFPIQETGISEMIARIPLLSRHSASGRSGRLP